MHVHAPARAGLGPANAAMDAAAGAAWAHALCGTFAAYCIAPLLSLRTMLLNPREPV